MAAVRMERRAEADAGWWNHSVARLAPSSPDWTHTVTWTNNTLVAETTRPSAPLCSFLFPWVEGHYYNRLYSSLQLTVQNITLTRRCNSLSQKRNIHSVCCGRCWREGHGFTQIIHRLMTSWVTSPNYSTQVCINSLLVHFVAVETRSEHSNDILSSFRYVSLFSNSCLLKHLHHRATWLFWW